MLELIKELCAENAPSGNEKAVRELIKKKINKGKSDFYEDSIGNIIACHRGEKGKSSITFFANMDEPSVIISRITEDGFLKFSPVGISDDALFSKRFLIGENNALGIVCGKTWHLSTDAQRENQPTADELFIDIGAKNQEDAEQYVSLGESGVFFQEFAELSPHIITSKALESRICCAALISLLNNSSPYEFHCAFTACEIVGNLGSHIAANELAPDYGVIFVSSPANDTPLASENNFYSKLDGGVILSVSDNRMMYDKKLVKLVTSTAANNYVPHQLKDKSLDLKQANSIISSGSGVKVCTLGIPTRYMGTPSPAASLNDIKNAVELAEHLVLELNQ
ncbi:MAG: hypothetical protein RR315_00910 [Oscillospiraceae bacterium]